MTVPEIVARRIGNEQQPIAVIDGFHPDPAALRAAACAASFEPALRSYPGIRADLPGDYFRAIGPILTSVLRAVFATTGKARVLDASFSIVTTAPEALSHEQRIPHVDAVEPGRFALVHYLSPGASDGTAFFRHRASGHETIDLQRAAEYLRCLDAESRANGAGPAAYIDGDTWQFEQISKVEARYNRAVIYRGALLHSGSIAPDAGLSADPANGRLTVTAFIAVD